MQRSVLYALVSHAQDIDSISDVDWALWRFIPIFGAAADLKGPCGAATLQEYPVEPRLAACHLLTE